MSSLVNRADRSGGAVLLDVVERARAAARAYVASWPKPAVTRAAAAPAAKPPTAKRVVPAPKPEFDAVAFAREHGVELDARAVAGLSRADVLTLVLDLRAAKGRSK